MTNDAAVIAARQCRWCWPDAVLCGIGPKARIDVLWFCSHKAAAAEEKQAAEAGLPGALCMRVYGPCPYGGPA